MDLYEVMRDAPATRRFRPDPVAHEVLVRVLDAARFAPSGGNRQGWRVIAVEDAGPRRGLRDLHQPPWRAYLHRTRAGAPPWGAPARPRCSPPRAPTTPRGSACCAAPTSSPTAYTRCRCT